MAAQSKACFCVHWDCGSELHWWDGCFCPQSGWSLVWRSPTECGVSECDGEVSIMRSPGPLGAVAPYKVESNSIKRFPTFHWTWNFTTVFLKPSSDSYSKPSHNITPSVFKISFNIIKETFPLIHFKRTQEYTHILFTGVYYAA
jgi:hypothetical protein